MKAFSKKETKLFFSFFLVFIFFIHWIGWNENSNFDLTRAVTEEKRLEIDSYCNNTGDRAYYNNHYYSNKAPGISFLAAPIYSFFNLFQNFTPQLFYPSSDTYITTNLIARTVENVNPGSFILSSMVLITIFTSSLFSALTVILIYKISRYFTKKEKYRILSSIIYGLGSLAFPYAIVFMGHAVGTFFAFLSFYLLFKAKHEKINEKKYFILAGLSSGFAIVCEYSTILIALAMVIFVSSLKKKKELCLFVLSCVVGISPFLLYNYIISGNPFIPTISYDDPSIFPPTPVLLSPNFYIFLRLLIFPYNGLFFYYPVFILSIIGLFLMYKQHSLEAILISFLLISFLVLLSMYRDVFGSVSFGIRYLLPIIPFLMLPLIHVIKKINIKVVLILTLVSIFVNFMGLQNLTSLAGSSEPWISQIYKDKISSFQIIANPLFDHYLPLFLQNGPRSRIIESLLDSRIDVRDIRDSFSINVFYVSPISIPMLGILTLKTSFIPITFLLIVTFLIWKKELLKNLNKKYILLFSLLLVIFILSFTWVDKMAYDRNWYPPESQENMTSRWMSQNATIVFSEPKINLNQLKFISNSYYKPRTLEIYFDNVKLQSYKIKNISNEFTSSFFVSNEGNHVIKFYSEEGCDRIFKVENKSDFRCISLAFRNVSIENVDNIINFIIKGYENNWHDLEKVGDSSFRWMSQNATLNIYSPNPFCPKVNMSIKSYYKPRTLHIFVNSISIGEYAVSTQKANIVPSICLNQGENVIKLQSKEGCDIPETLENSADSRCLSFEIFSLELLFTG